MESLRQIALGFLFAFLSAAMLLGGYSLAITEGQIANNEISYETPSPFIPSEIPTIIAWTDTPQPTASVTATIAELPTATMEPSGTLSPSVTVEFVATHPATKTLCPNPAGWTSIIVQSSDTLFSIAQTYGMTQNDLRQGNCLRVDELQAGSLLYVKAEPIPTIWATISSCGAPYGWINYFVVSGDTLYNIGQRYGVTVEQIQKSNCMGFSTSIQVGMLLKLPDIATIEPWYPPTEIIYPTETQGDFEPTLTEFPLFEIQTPTNEIPSATPEPNLSTLENPISEIIFPVC